MPAIPFRSLRRLPKAILAFSEAVSEDVHGGKSIVMRFIDALMNLHPKLRLAILLSTPWISLAVALARYRVLIKGLATVKQYLFGCMTGSVLIPTAHPLYRPVMAHMVKQGLGRGARKLALQIPQAKDKMSRREQYMYDMGLSHRNKPLKQEEEDEKPDALELIPDVGSFTFSHNGKRLTFEKRAASSEKAMTDHHGVLTMGRREHEETIVLSCMNLLGNTQPITDFLQHIKESTDKATESMTKIFRPESVSGQINWDAGVARPARTLDAVTLDAHVKDPLVADIQNYLNDKTKKFYISRNIPWRRGYLFYGPPGTGKTSMACAIAGQYGLNVYLLSMTQTGINDETLVNLFEALPSKCILLLEDIDSAGIKREDMKENAKPAMKASKKRGHHRSYTYGTPRLYDEHGNPVDPNKKNKVTLSTLLNVLDGISAPEGRIVIMTSNNPDSLDKALVRPGRIDRKVLFDHATHEVSHKLFLRVFGEYGDPDVASMAQTFANQIPENVITPAEVQGHLLQNMASAAEALENTSNFVEAIMAEKKSGTNVAGFKAEVAETQAKASSQQKTETPSSIEFKGASKPLGSIGTHGMPAALLQQMMANRQFGPSLSAESLPGAPPPSPRLRQAKTKTGHQAGASATAVITFAPETAETSAPSSMPTNGSEASDSTSAPSVSPTPPVSTIPAVGQGWEAFTKRAMERAIKRAMAAHAMPSINVTPEIAGVKPAVETVVDDTSSVEEISSDHSTSSSADHSETSSVGEDEDEDISESELEEDGEKEMVDTAQEST